MTDKDNIIPEEKLLEVYEHLMNHKYGYLEDLNKLNPKLLGLYDQIMVLNSYLTFITKEEINELERLL